MTTPDEISAEELATLLGSDASPRIVDIRSSAAFAEGHIPTSENVPFAELPATVERFADDDHIVTVCPHGQASLQAVRLIRAYENIDDARIESLAGGLADWNGEIVANGDAT